AVDVQVDFLVAVLVLQEQQLLNRDVREIIGDGGVAAGLGRAAQENDPVFQEQIAQGHLSLPHVLAGTLDHGAHRTGRANQFRRNHAQVLFHDLGASSVGFSSAAGGAVGSCISPGTACSSTVATCASSAAAIGVSSYSAEPSTRSSAFR